MDVALDDGSWVWDTLALPLERGDNELLFAVSEDFGGWGVQARFVDPGGIQFADCARAVGLTSLGRAGGWSRHRIVTPA